MVEWKKLGEVCEVLDSQRKPVSKGNRSQGEYPYYGANGIQDYVDGYIFDGTYLLLGEDGSVINTDNSPVLHWATGKIWVNNHAHILQENNKALLRYLYYTLQSTDVSDIVRGMPPKINQANMRNILIPIPSFEEQTRIVGILDTFTSAIDNLKEQIAQRRKQYEYYRDKLLDLEGKERVEWKKLGDVANLVRGKVISKDYIRDFGGEFPVYSSQTANDGVLGKINSYMFDGDYLTWTTDGAYAGTIFRRKGKFSITNVCGLIDISCSNIQQDFLYFWLSKTAKDYVLEGMGNPKLMSNVASTIKIPIPPLQEQQRIVTILDTFEASIQNLEAQLKEREKQYEYYRNKLLTFE